MMRRALLVASVGLSSACREEVKDVQIVFGAGNMPSEGLVCRDTDDPLAAQIWTEGDGSACLVLDLVPTEGSPGCRLSELLAWCSNHECTPDPDRRVRIDLDPYLPDVLPQGPNVGIQLWNKLRNDLSGTVVLPDAPETFAILRATIIGRACEEVGDEPRFSCGDVLGCVYSCPLALGSFEGEVVLDLDTLSQTTCVRDVRVCSADHLFDRDHLMAPCDTDALVP